MKESLYKEYLSERFDLSVDTREDDEILEGSLVARDEKQRNIPIKGGIPRFSGNGNYAENFGLQWNVFRATQLDSVSGRPISTKRFWTNTKWTEVELKGKTVLEVGSGAGRFTEVLLACGAKVVSFDFSGAVEANYTNNRNKGDLFLFQGDLYDIPFPDKYFDYVFCYGVLQHTPDPDAAYRSIFSKLKPGGKISIDYYRKLGLISPWSTPKRIWRPICSRLPPALLLKIIRFYIPKYLPIDTFIRKIPKIGFYLAGLIPIPCWNYTRLGLSDEERRIWAIMDTFDALGARYDQPKTLEKISEMVESADNSSTDIFYGSNGIVANVVRK
ncbi:MAG: methyltransferase domain-containing protein [Gammaproteobacteria bacterium]|nr:methyltransferase domain-containing protein [Gammaproteobacteria bacterium]